MKLNKILAALFAGALLTATSQAVLFDVTSVSGTSSYGASFATDAAGTSGGVNWKASGDIITYLPLTTTNGTYTGFAGLAPALSPTDNLHTFGTDMTISFDQTVTSILFYLKENGGNSTLDFGLAPTLVDGSATISGNAVTGLVAGGVVRFTGIFTSLSSTASVLDGMDAAWVVESSLTGSGATNGVPDSGTTFALLGLSLLALAAFKRRSRG